ncbi:MAG: hypothetical protein EPN17_17735 [Methylobacter sp.]|nr:MAG: hypothetical protein EPN17_17735 [Methylobacter sp.]
MRGLRYRLDLNPAAKNQVAEMIQALLDRTERDAKTIQLKDFKIEALTHELAERSIYKGWLILQTKPGLIIRLVYYPPYHSKYNAIARFWAGLEKSWNGYLLDAQETVLQRAGNFIWKGTRATVTMIAGAYEKGVKLAADQVRQLEARLQRSTALKWWDITISQKKVF